MVGRDYVLDFGLRQRLEDVSRYRPSSQRRRRRSIGDCKSVGRPSATSAAPLVPTPKDITLLTRQFKEHTQPVMMARQHTYINNPNMRDLPQDLARSGKTSSPGSRYRPSNRRRRRRSTGDCKSVGSPSAARGATSSGDSRRTPTSSCRRRSRCRRCPARTSSWPNLK